MGNQAWLDRYQNAEVTFMNEGSFDHCPALLQVYPEVRSGRKPFRYFRMWQKAPGFLEKLREVWQDQVYGAPMFKLVQKLRKFKGKLKDLNKVETGDINVDVSYKLQELHSLQSELQNNPRDRELIIQEKEARERYEEARSNLISFLRQKAKLHWLKDGDENTSMFHASIRARRTTSRVYAIEDKEGCQVHEPHQITVAFLSFYEDLLGTAMAHRKSVMLGVIKQGPLINETHKRLLQHLYTDEDVKNSTFAIPGNKLPGPDGYSSFFFQTIGKW
ncbi:uncharacterized protein LOC133785891 [Humulus lupulus]|uniref:uncharacterized protein LOC133785891 n=1 Tax=Humulus lupulus TaxID=3486 RepID=UPI002B401136|nr:uncharacterized protein LOC133785891 [Humulus lupulus]